jgi:5-methylcytosine-specific restriction endonuclease McrA
MDSLPQPLKRCSKCGEEKPATTEFFRPRPTAKDGLRNECRVCIAEYEKEYRATHAEKIAKVLSDYYQEHKEYLKHVNREWALNHPEVVRVYKQNYEMRNPDNNKRYYQENKDKVIAAQREYRKNHPPSPLKLKAGKQRRRARILGGGGSFTEQDELAQYDRQHGKCYWCGKKVGKKYHVDHVQPLSRGGTNYPSNIVIACPTCNLSKSDKLPHEWQGNNGKLL